MSPITVAVIGASGNLGTPVIHSFLDKDVFPTKVARVIFFTRDPASEKAKALKELGAEPVQVSDGAISAGIFKGVDVAVNTLGHSADPAVQNAYTKAAAEAGVKVYIPSEFGSDHALWDVKHAGFEAKGSLTEYARKVGEGRWKVVAILPGGFLEWVISGFLGIDFTTKVITVWGDPNSRISVTSIRDIADTVARASVLAANDPNSVPDHLRIAGDSRSYNEIAEILSKVTGETFKVVGTAADYEKVKAELDEKHNRQGDFYSYIRLLFASGKADLGPISDNEVVNPGESLWKWKSIAEWAQEIHGKSST